MKYLLSPLFYLLLMCAYIQDYKNRIEIIFQVAFRYLPILTMLDFILPERSWYQEIVVLKYLQILLRPLGLKTPQHFF